MSEPALDVVIVAYRCESLLRDCLTSLAEHPARRGMATYVVDNASGDGTADMVAREFPDMELTRLPENRGFAAANNLAIRAARAPNVLVLNPDTRVTARSLDTLVAVLDTRPTVAICGPRLERPDGTFDHAARRSFPTPLSALGHFTGVGRRLGRGNLAAYRAPEVTSGPVDAVNGACMLIRRSILDEVGLFDEGYWMYMEDLDLCYRFAQRGWTTWYEPSVRVVHAKGGSSGHPRPARLDVAFHYGMYRFYRKHYAATRAWGVNAAVYGGIAVKLALSTARGALRALVAKRRRQLFASAAPAPSQR